MNDGLLGAYKVADLCEIAGRGLANGVREFTDCAPVLLSWVNATVPNREYPALHTTQAESICLTQRIFCTTEQSQRKILKFSQGTARDGIYC